VFRVGGWCEAEYTNGSYTSRSYLGQSVMVATFSLGFGDSVPNSYSVHCHRNSKQKLQAVLFYWIYEGEHLCHLNQGPSR
jgi:hypothetical protein